MQREWSFLNEAKSLKTRAEVNLFVSKYNLTRGVWPPETSTKEYFYLKSGSPPLFLKVHNLFWRYTGDGEVENYSHTTGTCVFGKGSYQADSGGEPW